MAKTTPTGTDNLFVISAPSGGGKSSLIRALLEAEPTLRFTISHTTRTRRQGEQDGVEYHFIDCAEFLERVRREEFLEHAVVHGNHYGTSRNVVLEHMDTDRGLLLELDWQGAAALRKHYPQTTSIFILPPSPEELLRRLHSRSQDSEEVILERMHDLETDLRHAADYDYRVVNDDFQHCLETLQRIVRAHRAGGRARVPEAPALLHRLLQEATQYR